MEELENEISTQAEENTVSLASAQALADALAKIEVYTPTTWVDNSSPDIDAEHLNKPEQAIKRVTDALNSAVDVIKDLQSQVTKNAGDISTVNNNLSKRLLVGDNIASADLLNDNPAERFGTLSMRFSDGAMNQLLLLKDTAVVTILRNNVWAEQYRFATTSMLSDYILKSGIKFVEQYLKSTQTLSPSGTTLLNDASITIPFDCIAILIWKLHCKSSEQKASLYYMVNNAYVQGKHQWDGTIQTDETVNIFVMGRFSKDQELTVSVQGNCSVVGNNTSLTRYSFAFIPV